jgi:squalene synthase HpnC
MTSDRLAATAMPAAGQPTGADGPADAWLALAGLESAGKAAAENFPVALRLLPARYRGHLMALYAFARTTDDAGDLAPQAQRPELLAELARDVRRLYAGLGPAGARAATGHPGPGAGSAPAGDPGPADDERAATQRTEAGEPRLAVVRGLAGTVTACSVPMQLFLDLIAAGQQDQTVTRYQTFAELADYCRLSANPVGRIVLCIFGASTPPRAELSDSVCTGLQIAEHLQDVGEDMRAGRIYLPADDLTAYGVTEQDLLAPSAAPPLRRLIEFETGRARRLLDAGAPLVGSLRGAARVAVAGYVAGGRAALAAIAAADYDVLSATPRPGKGRTAAELVTTLVRAR